MSPKGHNYGGQWFTDENKHWQTCLECGDETLPKNHTYDGKCDADCNECGYERDAGHIYDDELIFNDHIAHWRQCEECGYQDSYEKHIPGEAATEESGQFCTVCYYEIAPALEHVHTYTYESDDNTHRGTCRCGHKTEPENHEWDMSTGMCSTCGAYGVQQTATTYRSWDFVWLIMAGAVVTTAVVTTVVMIRSGKKRKAANV